MESRSKIEEILSDFRLYAVNVTYISNWIFLFPQSAVCTTTTFVNKIARTRQKLSDFLPRMLAARLWTIVCSVQLVISLNYKHDYRGFDDSILYEIDWPGKDVNLEEEWQEDEKYSIVSTKEEGYTCYIPPLKEAEGKESEKYTGPTPFELLSPLFISGGCSYRIDSFWSYEICHGNYIKQFHEERDRIQEYYLGKIDKTKLEAMKEKDETDKEGEAKKYPQKKIDGNNMAYFEMEMTDGTLCDLNNEPRTTKVLYVCYAHGKNEIYSLKETSTCNYEVIILTPTLCGHPLFKGQEASNNKIKCVPEGEAPKKPEDLYPFEVTASPNKDFVSNSRRWQILCFCLRFTFLFYYLCLFRLVPCVIRIK